MLLFNQGLWIEDFLIINYVTSISSLFNIVGRPNV